MTPESEPSSEKVQTYQALCVTHGAVSPVCVKTDSVLVFVEDHRTLHPECDVQIYPVSPETKEENVERRR